MDGKVDIFNQFKMKMREYRAECRIVSAKYIPELEHEYKLSLNSRELNHQFVENYIENYIDFKVVKENPLIQSVIIMATPSPQINVRFQYNGSSFFFKIPPQYPDRIRVTGRTRDLTSQIFNDNGYQTFPVVLPKKLLAAHGGLAKYGRNNLTYVPGMGSYHRLTVFASDLPCENDHWQERQLLERCNRCRACQINCPTGAIDADRFIIKAERCLSYYNEHEEPFPVWVDAKYHNSIIGCMGCQDICPENKPYRTAVNNEDEFTDREMNLILEEVPFENLPKKLQEKFSKLCLHKYYKYLSRNLKLLIENKTN